MLLIRKAVLLLTVSFGFGAGTLSAQGHRPAVSGQDLSQKFFAQDEQCRAMLKNQKWDEGEPICKVAVRLADQLPADRELEKMEAYELFGHILMGQKRYQEAITYYSRANEIVHPKLNDTNAEVGHLYRDIAIAYHYLQDLGKAREFYRKAEKTYQLAYASINPAEVTEEGVKMKLRYMRTLKEILQYHIQAAEQSGVMAEAAELRKQLEGLP